MQSPTALPGFWNFMYRVSPLTYLIAGMCGNALHGQPVRCSSRELSVFSPPQGQTCGQYLADWLSVSAGQLYNPSAVTGCEYCAFTTADQYMSLNKICKWEGCFFPILHDCSVAEKLLITIIYQTTVNDGATLELAGPILGLTLQGLHSCTMFSVYATTSQDCFRG